MIQAGVTRRNKHCICIEWSQARIPARLELLFNLGRIDNRVTLRMVFFILFLVNFLIGLLHVREFEDVVCTWRFRRKVFFYFHLTGRLRRHGFLLSGSAVNIWVAVAQEGGRIFSLHPWHPRIGHRHKVVPDEQLLEAVHVTLGLRRLQITLRLGLHLLEWEWLSVFWSTVRWAFAADEKVTLRVFLALQRVGCIICVTFQVWVEESIRIRHGWGIHMR